MATPIAHPRPQVYARLAGLLYLLIIVAGAFGERFVRGELVVPGDAASTASNLLASQSLWRTSIAVELLMHVLDIPLMLALYLLLKPVSRPLASLAVLFNLIQTAVLAANKLNLVMPLLLLGHADYLKSFEPSQIHALIQLSLRLHGYGFGIGLIFFACACLVLGYLIATSGYFPLVLGLLMALAGLSYLTNSLALLLAPALSALIVPAILVPAFVGEVSFALWLLVKGVNAHQWARRAQAS